MQTVPRSERVVIGADLNEHVGEENSGDEEVMGRSGSQERNPEGQRLVDFAKSMEMAVVNTYFEKRRCNLIEISDCKVVLGESVARLHRMVVCKMTLVVTKMKRVKAEQKTKWWKLEKEECCVVFREELRQALGERLPNDWTTTAKVIRETDRKVLGVSCGRRKEDMETLRWNEEVQEGIQRKRLARKKWDSERMEESRQEYRVMQ
ncbi:uncharacterized protein [Pseudorasbora parva]|uniref:uncharacterized protein n=1 Tax=Pseudorasbora parva TaxID=51549 RepID=UPI00351E41A0